MRRGDQLLRVGAGALLEARGERVLCIGQHAAVRRNRAFAVLQTSLPAGRSFAFHAQLLFANVPRRWRAAFPDTMGDKTSAPASFRRGRTKRRRIRPGTVSYYDRS